MKLAQEKRGKVGNDTIGALYRIWPKKSGVTRIFWNEPLQHGEQINRNFGIKLFYPKIRGHVFTPKFRKKNVGKLEASKIASSMNQLHKGRYQLI